MNSIIRAWKDPVYRGTLTATEQAELASPAGIIELTGTDLDQVAGGWGDNSGKSGKSGKSDNSGKSGKSGKSHNSGKSGKSGKC